MRNSRLDLEIKNQWRFYRETVLAQKLWLVFLTLSAVLGVALSFDYFQSRSPQEFRFALVINGLEILSALFLASYFYKNRDIPVQDLKIKPSHGVLFFATLVVVATGIYYLCFPSVRGLIYTLVVNAGLSYFLVIRTHFYLLLLTQMILYVVHLNTLSGTPYISEINEGVVMGTILLAIGFFIRIKNVWDRFCTLQELEQEQKNAANSVRKSYHAKLASGLSHQINNPLAIILGAAELMEREQEKKGEAAQGGVYKIKSAALRIKEIIHSMTAVTESEVSGGEKDFSFSEIFKSIRILFSDMITRAHVNFEIKDETLNYRVPNGDQMYFLVESLVYMIFKEMAEKALPEKKNLVVSGDLSERSVLIYLNEEIFPEGEHPIKNILSRLTPQEAQQLQMFVDHNLLAGVKLTSEPGWTFIKLKY